MFQAIEWMVQLCDLMADITVESEKSEELQQSNHHQLTEKAQVVL